MEEVFIQCLVSFVSTLFRPTMPPIITIPPLQPTLIFPIEEQLLMLVIVYPTIPPMYK